MLDRVHFISGLPRSGSTLLAAILRQNPRFRTDITGPAAQLCRLVHQTICGTGEFAILFNDERRAQMLRGIFDTYYAEVQPGTVVFDTNRSWTGRAALLGKLYPQCRIICCVREIGWILDSLERMRLKNPLKLSKLFTYRGSDSIYTRVDGLMHSENGLVGGAWSNLREAWFSDSAQRLILVPYSSLTEDPQSTLRRLYTELGEPYFEHDFGNVSYDAREYDDHLGMPGLHEVRRVVECRPRQPVIPPEIFNKYARSQFWKDP